MLKKKIADVDACSLYPSAMYFMEGSFLKDYLMYEAIHLMNS